MIQSVNFPIARSCVAPYGSWSQLENKVHSLGLDGVEAIADPDELDESFPKSLVSGYHLIFYPDWLDFWREDEKALLRKFHSWDMIGKIYRGRRPEDLMRQFRADLELAIRLGTPYVVFHVSDVSLEESYTYRWLHSDEEVLEGAVAFINELLRGIEPSFDFLVENQWWPGFTFTDPVKTDSFTYRLPSYGDHAGYRTSNEYESSAAHAGTGNQLYPDNGPKTRNAFQGDPRHPFSPKPQRHLRADCHRIVALRLSRGLL